MLRLCSSERYISLEDYVHAHAHTLKRLHANVWTQTLY